MDQQARETAFMSALTTEHFVLQSARGSLVSEQVGRAVGYFSAVSSSLIALAFLNQMGTRIDLVVGAVLPALFILGELTFVAMLRNSLVNLAFMRRMQRIRGFYRGLVPEAEQFFDSAEADCELEVDLATVGLRGGPGAMLFTGASTIAAVNSILGGVGAGLLVSRFTQLHGVLMLFTGVLTAAVLFLVHLLYERRRSAGVRSSQTAGGEATSSPMAYATPALASTVSRPIP
jgi:hypothetical protein